ncbi:peroxisomal sarcosine oxidase-like isoform X2 [Hydractinia symbiolongicarpus]|nr:peroxisomal sarcosine oxidase-like isoform X2 [Hydractinia symbiolongicarpus]XP_057295583.1 peroxisomal sarcosine oxidase-like isoform X2 [Hydractinia symbiolongicarpus]XP_057295584.1 peroxisomal sarcosine oxidase-like isoform X2 [Hydractinia symbiolongicarpus]
MSNHIYDVCVVGAGVNGSASAYSLAKQKKDVLLLEQFPVPHTRGSSHGQSRIVRCLYPSMCYAKTSFDSFALWKQLEKEVDDKLLIQNGILEVFKNGAEKLKRCLEVLDRLGAPYDLLTAEQINIKYPLLKVPHGYSGIVEHNGGMVLASKCVAALQKVFVRNGGVFQDGEPVTRIMPGSTITIHTKKGKYYSRSLIITAGPFTSKLTKPLGLNLPLNIRRTRACYWRLKEEKSGSTSHCPSFIMFGIYGLACHEYPGLIKICQHTGPIVDIDYPDVAHDIEEVKNFVRLYTDGVEERPSIVENCLYTLTPDRDFIIDVHPKYQNIVIGAGFSGTGFKMAPATGNILADLALGRIPSYDISKFKMGRFPAIVDKKSSL